jgi:hypothetical protein
MFGKGATITNQEKEKLKRRFGVDISINKINTPYLIGYVIKKNNKTVATWINGVVNTKPFN